MRDPSPDPQQEVRAPVERALSWLIIRGAIWFAGAVFAVVATVVRLEGDAHLVAHLLLPGLLVGVVLVRAVRASGPNRPNGSGAWERAREIDRADTRLAAVTAAAVPMAWLIGGVAVLVRHAMEDAPAVVSLYGPLFLIVWLGATLAWLADCRDCLAGALAESDRRFRAYWQRLAGTPGQG